jgi:NADH-quinone oxidoreductase subunit L
MNLVLAAVEGVGIAGAQPPASGSAIDLAWLIPVVPAVSAALLLLVGRRLGPAAAWVAIAAAGFTAVLSTLVFLELRAQPEDARVFLRTVATWLEIGSLSVDWEVLVDPLAAMMLLLVTWVGLLIHVYSVGYMHGDEGYTRYFAYLNLFLASMLVLVLGSSFLVLFVGWELVGLCSYLLIGFWFERREYATAAKKAFVVNRIGDVGFMIAMFVIFSAVGSLAFADVFPAAGTLATGTLVVIGLLLFVGVTGKSAQIPLFVWLPDAMAGPTPVSALIHAATMVTAGVYLVARSAAIFALVPDVGLAIAWVGIATALLGALIAAAQVDLKRILAYSTVSQLGYMIVGVGVGDYVGGIFHLLTHGFFKALLFLAAGSVMHAMANETDVWKMGGLARHMPVTAITAAIGVLAISGVPPLSGFFSKEEILASAAATPGGQAIWVLGIVVAALTAFYMGRWYVLIFLGRARWSQDLHPHESPLSMTLPLVVLAVASAAGGLLNIDPKTGFLHGWLAASVPLHEPRIDFLPSGALLAAAVVAGLLGLAFAWDRYLRRRHEPLEAETTQPYRWAFDTFYVDKLYERGIMLPGRIVAAGSAAFDRTVIDGAVNGVGRLTSGLGRLGRRTQTGFVRSYALAVLAGTVFVTALLLGGLLMGRV